MPQIRLHLVQTTAELEALEPEWTRLWASSPTAKPFQHPGWLLPWWRHFAQPELRCVTMRDQASDALLALLPLYIYPDPISGERQLLFLGAGTSDYLDAIVSAASTVDHLTGAFDLLAEAGGWDVAYLTQLARGSLVAESIPHLASMDVRPFAGEPTSRCPATGISGLPTKVRREVLFCRNAAIAHGRLELVAATEATLFATFDELRRTHTERWRELGQTGVLADPAVLAWHREALPGLLRAGLLRLLSLTLAGRPLATMYSLIDPADRRDRTQYLYLMGHSPDHADLQPGRLLTAYTLEQAAAEGVQSIDMLRGEETYKRFWHVQPVATLGFSLRR